MKAIKADKINHLAEFKKEINNASNEQLRARYGYYSSLIPKGKDISRMTDEDLIKYLIKRQEAKTYKSLEQKAKEIEEVAKSGKLVSIQINVEWIRSRTWGANPKAEAWIRYEKEGQVHSYRVQSESIGGCGYDKLSTAVAQVLNQSNEVLKLLWKAKNKEAETKSHDLLGYGSGYAILPRFEGGVGVSCYNPIFNKIGYTFKQTSFGKTFDCFEVIKGVKK